MTYILVIWTIVGAHAHGYAAYQKLHQDWRPIGEFHMEDNRMGKKTAKEMCEEAARQLALKPENFRCVRSK
jgi:hypothetical protein